MHKENTMLLKKGKIDKKNIYIAKKGKRKQNEQHKKAYLLEKMQKNAKDTTRKRKCKK